MNKSILFIVHHTQDCQDYNEHSPVTTEKEADELFVSLVTKAKSLEEIVKVYKETEDEFYFETKNTQQKIYVTKHEL